MVNTKAVLKGLVIDKEGDYWECSEEKRVKYQKTFLDKGVKKNRYTTKRADCKNCPIKSACIGKGHEKRIDITYYKEEYDRGIARLKTRQGRRFKYIRSSTVEPVFGSLTQFFGMRKVNTIGLKQANKVMMMSGAAYNLKKYLKFVQKIANSKVEVVKNSLNEFFVALNSEKLMLKPSEF